MDFICTKNTVCLVHGISKVNDSLGSHQTDISILC